MADAPFRSLTLVRNATKDQVNAALQAASSEKDKFSFFFNRWSSTPDPSWLHRYRQRLRAHSMQTKGASASITANLAAAGIDAKNIDIVAISHFHGDHMNGLLTADNKPRFPNAEIMVPAVEWAYWMDDGNMSRAPAIRMAELSRTTAGCSMTGLSKKVTPARMRQGRRSRHEGCWIARAIRRATPRISFRRARTRSWSRPT